MCEKCKKRQKCVKKLTIHRWPRVLVLHIKRFQYTSVNRDKLTTSISFQFHNLDLGDYISESRAASGESPPVYDLFATSNHIGGLGGGHYVANCLNRQDLQWYLYNDSVVSSTSSAELQGPMTYVLFYSQQSPGAWHAETPPLGPGDAAATSSTSAAASGGAPP